MLDTLHTHVQGTTAGRRGVRQVYCLEAAPLLLADGTPLYLDWIIEGEDGTLHRVPAEPGGWLRRSPYVGQSSRLKPVSTGKAEAIVRLTCADVDDPVAVGYTFEYYNP